MINKELVKGLAQKIDSLFDWNKIIKNVIIGQIAEFADGYILSYGLEYLNTEYGDKIPTEYVDEVEGMIQKFIEGDYVGMLEIVPAGFDQAIDIKCFDDDFEAIFIATVFNGMVKAAIYYSNVIINK
jgi:hypothetical protein